MTGPVMRTWIISEGELGVSVGSELDRRWTHRGHAVRSRVISDPTEIPDLSDADLAVLCAWRDDIALADVVETRAYEAGCAWLPVVMSHPYLRCGPLVRPGDTACYSCFRRRLEQHEVAGWKHRALQDAYMSSRDAGVRGHLEGHVVLAASLVDLLARAFLDGQPEAQPNAVVWSHLWWQETISDRVVGVHGCPRCGTPDGTAPRYAAGITDLVERLGCDRGG